MTKDEAVAILKTVKRVRLEQDLIEHNANEAIKSTSVFKVGELVLVKEPDLEPVLVSVGDIGNFEAGEYFYVFLKLKKDGTVSTQRYRPEEHRYEILSTTDDRSDKSWALVRHEEYLKSKLKS